MIEYVRTGPLSWHVQFGNMYHFCENIAAHFTLFFDVWEN